MISLHSLEKSGGKCDVSLTAGLSCLAPAHAVELSDWWTLNIVLNLTLPRFPQLGVFLVPLAALVLSILLTLHDHDQVTHVPVDLAPGSHQLVVNLDIFH